MTIKPKVTVDRHFQPAKFIVSYPDGSATAHNTHAGAINEARASVFRDTLIRNLMVDLGMIPGEARS